MVASRLPKIPFDKRSRGYEQPNAIRDYDGREQVHVCA